MDAFRRFHSTTFIKPDVLASELAIEIEKRATPGRVENSQVMKEILDVFFEAGTKISATIPPNSFEEPFNLQPTMTSFWTACRRRRMTASQSILQLRMLVT